eukprot:symbB.v1.2.031366.t1/scaffold3570.1/size53993/4
MPFEDISELSDDNQFKTPQKKSDESNAGSQEVEQQTKKIPKVAKPKKPSCKPKSKSQMKRPSSKTEAVEEHGQDDQEEGQEHEKDDTVKKRPATKAVEKHGQDDEAAEQGQEPDKDDAVKKRPAGKKPKAAAVMKRPSGPSGVKKERAYMCYYKRDCVFGIKWKGSEVMRVKPAKGVSAERMREIADAARLAFEDGKGKQEEDHPLSKAAKSTPAVAEDTAAAVDDAIMAAEEGEEETPRADDPEPVDVS